MEDWAVLFRGSSLCARLNHEGFLESELRLRIFLASYYWYLKTIEMFNYTKENLSLYSPIPLDNYFFTAFLGTHSSFPHLSTRSLQVWSSSILQRNPILQKASRSMEELSSPSISHAPAYKIINYLPYSFPMSAFE